MKKLKKILFPFLLITIVSGLLQFNGNFSGAVIQKTDKIIQDRLRGAVAIYSGSMYALVNNSLKTIDIANELITPFSQEGNLMVPIRFIAEAFGAKVAWNEKAQTATLALNEKTIKITLYSTKMKVDNRTVKMDVPAMSTGGRIFIPLNSLAEALGKKVFYEKGLAVISGSSSIFNRSKEKPIIEKLIQKVNLLPTVGSRAKLVAILEKAAAKNGALNPMDVISSKKSMSASAESNAKAASDSSGGRDYSKTNIQVEGVDEGDIVKTDGEYIYQAADNKVYIYKAYPADKMELVGTISFTNEQVYPYELYIYGNKLVVIGQTNLRIKLQAKETVSETQREYYPVNNYEGTMAIVYDVSNKSKPTKVREASIQGQYLSSRLIGKNLYIISNQYIYNWQDENVIINPYYKDSSISSEIIEVPYNKIKYIPPIASNSYLLIAGLSLEDLDKAVNVEAYLGAGQGVYASLNNLYISAYEGIDGVRPMRRMTSGFMPPLQQPATLIYKFSLMDGKAEYKAKGQVLGSILNQFSMDEDKGKFRIATTIMNNWSRKNGEMENNVFILDENMNSMGKLEGLAKGEKIYSVRFMGDRAYVVTFKKVDPLFVIDLTNHTEPKVLGALKIPGYSDYLHPYDENHIIGFGKDTTIHTYKDLEGKIIDTVAYYLGMKIALFDVSDVANPKEKAVVKIGDRGTESELLRDHKALLFDKKSGLLAFPITEAKVDEEYKDNDTGIPRYGNIVFYGAYVFKLNPKEGFVQKGKITHVSDEEYKKAGNNYVDYSKQIRRMLFIEDVLYGVSNSKLTAHDIDNLKLLETVEVK